MNAPLANKNEQYYRTVPGSGVRRHLVDLWNDKSRLHRLAMIGGVVLVAGVSLAVWLSGGRFAGTEDAYVRAAKLMVTTDVSGIVQSVAVREGQHVKQGQVLFRLDPEPFAIAVANERAALDQAALDLSAAKAGYRSLLGQVRAQQAQLRLAQATYRRQQALARDSAISLQQRDEAFAALQTARAGLVALTQSAETQLAKLNGDPDLPLRRYPAYLKAKAALDEARRQLDHTVVRAPFSGVVGAVDSLQPGTLVVSSLSSFSTTSSVGLISDKDVWVTANMKETDLTHVREGDAVEIDIDTYPDRVWHGRVQAISRGSDSTFSILPTENSSANWVKVVQRIPVRIEIDAKAGDPPLRAGMSAVVSIDTGRRRWWRMLHGGTER